MIQCLRIKGRVPSWLCITLYSRVQGWLLIPSMRGNQLFFCAFFLVLTLQHFSDSPSDALSSCNIAFFAIFNQPAEHVIIHFKLHVVVFSFPDDGPPHFFMFCMVTQILTSLCPCLYFRLMGSLCQAFSENFKNIFYIPPTFCLSNRVFCDTLKKAFHFLSRKRFERSPSMGGSVIPRQRPPIPHKKGVYSDVGSFLLCKQKSPRHPKIPRAKWRINCMYGITPDFSGKKVFLRGLRVTSDRSRFRIATGQLIHQLNSAYQVLAPQYPSASSPLDFW